MAKAKTYKLTGTQIKYLNLLRNQLQAALSKEIDEIMAEANVPKDYVLSDDMTEFVAP